MQHDFFPVPLSLSLANLFFARPATWDANANWLRGLGLTTPTMGVSLALMQDPREGLDVSPCLAEQPRDLAAAKGGTGWRGKLRVHVNFMPGKLFPRACGKYVSE